MQFYDSFFLDTDVDGSNLCVLNSSATDDWITVSYVKVNFIVVLVVGASLQNTSNFVYRCR